MILTDKAMLPIPPTETSFTKYFARVPADTDLFYHVMVGPDVLTFVREMGEHFGSKRPQIFGFIDSLEAVDIANELRKTSKGSSKLWKTPIGSTKGSSILKAIRGSSENFISTSDSSSSPRSRTASSTSCTERRSRIRFTSPRWTTPLRRCEPRGEL
jgi:hypothetical protein